MIPEKILYTDGHEVTVTDSFFKVKKSLYELKGITKHGFSIIHPDRLIPFLVLLLGIVMLTLWADHLIPGNFMSDLKFYSIEINANNTALSLGIGLFVTGALLLALMKDRYAIRIATAEGEKNVVVSRKKEYIYQILDALNHAFLNLITPGRKQSKR